MLFKKPSYRDPLITTSCLLFSSAYTKWINSSVTTSFTYWTLYFDFFLSWSDLLCYFWNRFYSHIMRFLDFAITKRNFRNSTQIRPTSIAWFAVSSSVWLPWRRRLFPDLYFSNKCHSAFEFFFFFPGSLSDHHRVHHLSSISLFINDSSIQLFSIILSDPVVFHPVLKNWSG